jgi:hypothetical protein
MVPMTRMPRRARTAFATIASMAAIGGAGAVSLTPVAGGFAVTAADGSVLYSAIGPGARALCLSRARELGALRIR